MEYRIYKFIQSAPTLTLLGLRKQPLNLSLRLYNASTLEVANSNKAFVAHLLENDVFPNVRTIHYYNDIDTPVLGGCDNATYTRYLNKYFQDAYFVWIFYGNPENAHIRYTPVDHDHKLK